MSTTAGMPGTATLHPIGRIHDDGLTIPDPDTGTARPEFARHEYTATFTTDRRSRRVWANRVEGRYRLAGDGHLIHQGGKP